LNRLDQALKEKLRQTCFRVDGARAASRLQERHGNLPSREPERDLRRHGRQHRSVLLRQRADPAAIRAIDEAADAVPVVPADAREYKLYKRYNGGPRLLIQQKAGTAAPGTIEEMQDITFPPHGGEVCYFIQWFDQHGNPSPLAELGCLTLAAKNPMPVPVMKAPVTAGTAEASKVTLAWFCPPEGVERFRVYIGDSATPLSTAPPPSTSYVGATIPSRTLSGVTLPSVQVTTAPGSFRSGVTYRRGAGKIFYFQPGHETYPVFKQAEPLRVVENAVRWLGTR
jgi:hypothetical protein